MSNLVVFYSRSGLTKKVGLEIANKLNADYEEIIDQKKQKKFIGFSHFWLRSFNSKDG